MEQKMTRREELIARVSPYCVKGDRLSKMMMIAADGVDYPTARRAVKGLDPSTYMCLMVLGGHREADAPQTYAEITATRGMQREAVFEMIEDGASFDEICAATMLGRETVGTYVSLYAKTKGVERDELPCVKMLKAQVSQKAKERMMRKAALEREKAEKRKRGGRMMYLKLREARIKKGLSCKEVADQLGMSDVHYAKIERGGHRLCEVHVPLLCDLMGITASEVREQTYVTEDAFRDQVRSHLNRIKAQR